MRTQTNTIVTALVLLSLVSGAVGCKSSGNGGPWYSPTSYKLYNPFNSASEAPPFDDQGTAHASTTGTTPKPSVGAQPNVTPPPGGYGSKEDEARFFADQKKQNSPVLQTQYNANAMTEQNKVASSTMNPPATPNPGVAAPAGGYSPADPYAPYAAASPYAANPGLVPNEIQHTSIKEPYAQPGAMPDYQPNPAQYAPAPQYNAPAASYQAPQYQAPQYQAPAAAPANYQAPTYSAPDYTNPGYGVQPQAQPAQSGYGPVTGSPNTVPGNPTTGYSPFGNAPVAEQPNNVNYGGAVQAGYQTAPTGAYGAPAATPSYGAGSYGSGFAAQPTVYQ